MAGQSYGITKKGSKNICFWSPFYGFAKGIEPLAALCLFFARSAAFGAIEAF